MGDVPDLETISVTEQETETPLSLVLAVTSSFDPVKRREENNIAAGQDAQLILITAEKWV